MRDLRFAYLARPCRPLCCNLVGELDIMRDKNPVIRCQAAEPVVTELNQHCEVVAAMIVDCYDRSGPPTGPCLFRPIS